MWLWLTACDGSDDDTDTDRVDETADSETAGPTADTGRTSESNDTGSGPPLKVEVLVRSFTTLTLARAFDVTSNRAADAELVCTSPDDPLEDFHVTGQLPGTLGLFGLLPLTAYACTLSAEGSEVFATSFTTDDVPDPVAFPTLTSSGEASKALLDESYLLFNHWLRDSPDHKTHRIMISDPEGRVRWYVAALGARNGGIAAEWTGDSIVFGGGDGVTPQRRALGHEVLYEMAPPIDRTQGYEHEARWVEGGMLTNQDFTVERKDGVPYEAFLVELTDTTTGEVTWTLGEEALIAVGLMPGLLDRDPYHLNAARRVTDAQGDAVWLSMRASELLVRVDFATKAVTDLVGHDRGLQLYDLTGVRLPETEWFYGQHDPWYGGNELVVFDNGGARPGPKYTRVVAYRRDTATRYTRLWELRLPDWYEPSFGSVDRLANGHWLVVSGHGKDGNPAASSFVLEYDAEADEIVWSRVFDTRLDSVYRAEVLDGCALFGNRRYCAAVQRQAP